MTSVLGLKLLRLAPLVSSTAGVMCAWDQQSAFSSWLDPDVPQDEAGKVLPRWFPAIFRKLIWIVSILHPLGGLLGAANALGPAGSVLDAQTKKLYLAGGFFAIAHLVYGKYAMRIIGTIWNQKVSGEMNLGALHPWLRMNLSRILSNNVPAVLFFTAAIVQSIEVKSW